jgi:hypothetical protein
MFTPLKDTYKFQRRHSCTILTHCSGICLEKLKEPIKHGIPNNPAKIEDNPAYIVDILDHHMTAVPSQNPNCRVNYTFCKRLPYRYISYI